MTAHNQAKVNRIESAAQDAGLLNDAGWVDETWAFDILAAAYGSPPAPRPVRIFGGFEDLVRVLLACYSG